MAYNKLPVTLTTASDGSVTGYIPGAAAITGRIITIIYDKDGTTPYAAGVDFAITLDNSSEGMWTECNVGASATRSPRQATHDTVGVASLYAAAGEPVEGPIVMVADRLRIAITSGGDAKTGQFTLVWSDSE